MTALRPLLLAVQFLTRFPVPLRAAPNPRELGRSVLYYPLVGLLLGASLAGLQQLLATVPPLVQAALVLAVWSGITGFLHLDGLADSADAWVGGQGGRERTLAIMKDPRCGPAGVAAVVLLLLLKFAALASLAEAGPNTALLAAPLLGRVAVLALFASTPYVRPGGLGAAMAAELPRRSAWGVVAASWLLCGLLLDAAAWWLSVLVLAGLWLGLRTALLRRLGGTTGDTAGATLELTEAAVLFTALLANH
ncbi:MAG TPA: adenosylcobinamide-GDP ribazoletransferase [Gammaproteobacteria bacterium]|nr:adenosylcobinamide-GDP ribazoletransferase [Gammaproteobacteria bacterium]